MWFPLPFFVRAFLACALFTSFLPAFAATQGVRQVNLALRGLDYDPVSNKLYGTSAQTNRLLQIDPNTGEVNASFDVGANPSRVALGGGRGLWIGLDGAGAVRRFNLDTLTAEDPIVIIPGGAVTDIAASPVDPYTLVVTVRVPGSTTVNGGDVTYAIRNGQLLPNGFAGHYVALLGNNVYVPNANNLYRLEIGPDGLVPITRGVAVLSADIVAYDNYIYHPSGYYLAATDFHNYGYPFNGGSPAINKQTDEIFYLAGLNVLSRYERRSTRPTGSVELGITDLVAGPIDLITWGTNRLAFHSSTNLYLLTTDALFLPADIEVSQSINAAAEFGQEVTITMTVTNKGPAAALAVTLTNYIETTEPKPSYVLRAVNFGPPGQWLSSSPLIAALGNIPSGGSASFAITVMPKFPGIITNRVTVGATNDFSPLNNTNAFAFEVKAPTSGLTRVHLPSLVDAAYDPAGRRIVAYADSLLWSIEPDGPALDQFAGPYFGARRVTASVDGTVYAGLYDGGLKLAKIPGTPEFLGSGVQLTDIATSPSDPNLLAISTPSGTSLFRSGEALPSGINADGYIDFSPDGSKLYRTDPLTCDLSTYSISQSGVTLQSSAPGVSCGEFTSANGLLFFDSGLVFDPAIGKAATNFPAFVPPVFYVPNSNGEVDVLNRAGGLWTVYRLRRDTNSVYRQFASRDIGAITNPIVKAVAAGNNHVAYETTSELVVIDLPADSAAITATLLRNSSGGVSIRFASIGGAQYRIETTPNLTNPAWVPYGATFSGTGGAITQPIQPLSGAAAFFRIVRVQ